MFDGIVALYQVMRDVKLSHSALDELIQKRLKSVLISAYQNVPYYRNLMRNISYYPLQDYRGSQDLKNFPITTKKTIKERDVKEFIQ